MPRREGTHVDFLATGWINLERLGAIECAVGGAKKMDGANDAPMDLVKRKQKDQAPRLLFQLNRCAKGRCASKGIDSALESDFLIVIVYVNQFIRLAQREPDDADQRRDEQAKETHDRVWPGVVGLGHRDWRHKVSGVAR